MLPLVKTVYTSFHLPRLSAWKMHQDRGAVHEVHFLSSDQPPLQATEVVAIHSGTDFTKDYPREEPRPPSLTVTIPGKNPLWNWSGKIDVPHPNFSKCRTQKVPGKLNPSWKIWTDLRTGEELIRINTTFLAPENS